MKRKRILILFVTLVLCILVLSALLVPSRQSSVVRAAEDKPKGKLTKVFSQREKEQRRAAPRLGGPGIQERKGTPERWERMVEGLA